MPDERLPADQFNRIQDENGETLRAAIGELALHLRCSPGRRTYGMSWS
jgi:hypothetical protein